MHLLIAAATFGVVIYAGVGLRRRRSNGASARLGVAAAGFAALVFVQLGLGALVAGLRAGLVYNTWPLIDGALVPDAAALFATPPGWRNLFENPLTVQFDHRMAAYALWVLAVLHAVDAARSRGGPALAGALAVAAAVTVQATLGVLTLIHAAPLALALAHQAMAIVLLTLTVFHAQRLTPVGAAARLGAPAAQSS